MVAAVVTILRQLVDKKLWDSSFEGLPGLRVCLTSDRGPVPGRKASAAAVPSLKSRIRTCGKVLRRGCRCSARHRKKIKIKIDFADFEKRSKIRFVNFKPTIGQSDSRLRRSIDQKNMGDKSAIKIGKKMAAENAQLRARGFP